jgi:hypothetical protein
LIDFNSFSPALPAGNPFTDVRNDIWYWSSTSCVFKTDTAWWIYFFNGVVYSVSYKSKTFYVWPVRGGQCGVDTSVICLAKTGQTTCWDANGNEIPCAGTGQDGDLQTGVAWPNPRFTDKGNGTVKDNLTGLIWLKNANPCGLNSWADALAYCNTLANGTAGLTDGSQTGDWRLPNVKELQSLIDFNSYNPGLSAGYPFTDVQSDFNPDGDPNSPYWYWANTQYVTTGKTYLAHRVTMFDGMTIHGNYITDSFYVWPVRDEKCPVSVDATFMPLKAGLLPIVIPLRVQPTRIDALIVIPSTLFGRFTPGEKAVGVASGAEFCSGTVDIL